jgi:hypothetical protein
VVKRGARQPKTLRGFHFVPPRLAQGLRDGVALERFQIGRRLLRWAAAALKREMLGMNKAALTENRRAFERVVQLSNIAGPRVSEERLSCVPSSLE